jgi:hypothetical protein
LTRLFEKVAPSHPFCDETAKWMGTVLLLCAGSVGGWPREAGFAEPLLSFTQLRPATTE